MSRTDFWTLWEKARVEWSERTASKHVYYQVWNRSPAQVGYMIQVLRAGTLGRPRGMGWGGRCEEGSGWGTHVDPWLIHVNVWQKPLQYCKLISLQLIKINEKKKKKGRDITLPKKKKRKRGLCRHNSANTPEVRSSWIIWVGPWSSNKCPYRRQEKRRCGSREKQRRPREDRGRD